MFLKKYIFFLLIFIWPAHTTAQSADTIIAKYINFIGGEQRWKAVHTLITSGIYNYGGIGFPFTTYSKAPNLYKFIVPFKGKYYAQAFDGKKGWKIDAFKNETSKTSLTGKPALALANEADVELESPFIDYLKKGHQAVIEGTDSINGKPCFRIKFIRNNGEIETYFFSKYTYEMVKKQAVSKNAEMENALLDTYYTDYTIAGGINIPYKSTSKSGEQTILTITIKEVKINTPIADSEFEK